MCTIFTDLEMAEAETDAWRNSRWIFIYYQKLEFHICMDLVGEIRMNFITKQSHRDHNLAEKFFPRKGGGLWPFRIFENPPIVFINFYAHIHSAPQIFLFSHIRAPPKHIFWLRPCSHKCTAVVHSYEAYMGHVLMNATHFTLLLLIDLIWCSLLHSSNIF